MRGFSSITLLALACALGLAAGQNASLRGAAAVQEVGTARKGVGGVCDDAASGGRLSPTACSLHHGCRHACTAPRCGSPVGGGAHASLVMSGSTASPRPYHAHAPRPRPRGRPFVATPPPHTHRAARVGWRGCRVCQLAPRRSPRRPAPPSRRRSDKSSHQVRG
jgi:hypothetical protein